MPSKKLSQTILEAERVGLLLYVVILIVGAAIVSFVALFSNDPFIALNAGVAAVSGVVVLSIIVYLETHVWNSE
jgi:membrane protein YdbS with pleckstrin-like domain